MQAPAEFEIVKRTSVPTFRVRNEQAYRVALAVKALSEENALRVVKLADRKKAIQFSAAVVLSCKKMGFRAKYRSDAKHGYFWREEKKA